MKQRQLSISGSVLALGAFLLLAGCNVFPPVQADTTRYYVIGGAALGEPTTAPVSGALRLGLKAVEVAPYLRKGSLVVRTGANEVAFPNDARWAEPLEQQITGALRQRLRSIPAVARVFSPPFPFEEARDFDVSVQVLHCEGVRTGGGSARFVAAIEISSTGPEARVVSRKTFVAPEAAWDGKDFARLAALLGDAVGALSQEVMAALPEKK